MKLTAKRLIPLVFVVVAILYLMFGFSLEQRRMIGDEKGWDPGSRAIPIGIGFLMLGLSIYLILKEVKSGETKEKPIDYGSIKLIGLTISLAIVYILSFRYVGFILSTNFLLFTLIYFNYKNDVNLSMIPDFLFGALASSGFILLIYSIGRYITRSLFLMGRQSEIEILTNSLFITGITFFVLAGLLLITFVIFNRALKNELSRGLLNPICIAAGMTEFLYLVFKQIFWVSLTKGFIYW